MCITIMLLDLVHSHCNQASFHSTTLHYFALCYFTLHSSKLQWNVTNVYFNTAPRSGAIPIASRLHFTFITLHYVMLHYNVTNVHYNTPRSGASFRLQPGSLSLWANSTGEHKVPWRKVKYWWKIIGVISMKCKKHSKAVR